MSDFISKPNRNNKRRNKAVEGFEKNKPNKFRQNKKLKPRERALLDGKGFGELP